MYQSCQSYWTAQANEMTGSDPNSEFGGDQSSNLSFANSIQTLKDGLYVVSPKEEKSQVLVVFK